MSQSAKEKLIKRLGSYWKLEAFSAVFIPLAALWFNDLNISLVGLFNFIPVSLLLVIGAVYWRLKLRRLQGKADRIEFTRALTGIRKLQIPSLILTIFAIILTAALWVLPNLSRGPIDQWTATTLTTLASLEYINYYHRQLQHFDNISDFKKLMAGKGFRRSQMRQDLDGLAARKG